MTRTTRRAAGCATALVLATGLVGCASGGSDGGSTAAASASSSASASASGSASAPATTEPSPAPSAPAGAKLITAERSGLRFAVPRTWQVNDVATVLESGDDADLAAIAKKMNLPLSQLKAAARTIDVAAFGPAVKGFAPNVNVQSLPVEELPTAEQLSMVMKMVGGTVESVDDVTTAAGPARVSRYRLDVGVAKVVGRQLGVKGPNGVVLITVSDITAQGADVVLAMVQGSLTTT
jgi:hypothetical protein